MNRCQVAQASAPAPAAIPANRCGSGGYGRGRWGCKQEDKIYTGEIGVVQVQADTYAKRFKCTSFALIAIGAIGAIAAIGQGIGSRHRAERIFTQPALHHGKPFGSYGPQGKPM